MKQNKNQKPVEQVMYLDKFVDKDTFRAFVYRENEQKLANSYEEFESLIASGLWFVTKSDIKVVKKREKKLEVVKSDAVPAEIAAGETQNGATSSDG